MKRIVIDIDKKNIKPASEINNLNTFIKGWFIKENLCDDLISFFENLPEEKKHSGKVGNFVTDTNIKKSLDYSFFAKEEVIIVLICIGLKRSMNSIKWRYICFIHQFRVVVLNESGEISCRVAFSA